MFVPVCPETECGFGVPRAPMQLVGNPDAPRLVTLETGVDLTKHLCRWISLKLNELQDVSLDGFIFKSRSPSCGVCTTPVCAATGVSPQLFANGLFASAFIRRFPGIPVTDDIELAGPQQMARYLNEISNATVPVALPCDSARARTRDGFCHGVGCIPSSEQSTGRSIITSP